MKGRMAIIGDGDSVLVFTAVGVDAYGVTNGHDAETILKKIGKDYRIIFITDVVAAQIEETVKKYSALPYPIILTVPSKEGSNGYGMKNLKNITEKALGVDLLFDGSEEGK